MRCKEVSYWFGLAVLVAAGCGGTGEETSPQAGEGAAADAPAAEEAAPAGAVAEDAPEVVSLPSGLRYQVLVAADGPHPKATDAVVVHYEGRLVDGTVFDSSYDRRAPTNFRLDQVIPGWTEALQLMSPGAKWRLTIPPELAYGDRGAGELIGPGATLIFDVELLSFEEDQPFNAQPLDLKKAQSVEAEQTATP